MGFYYSTLSFSIELFLEDLVLGCLIYSTSFLGVLCSLLVLITGFFISEDTVLSYCFYFYFVFVLRSFSIFSSLITFGF